MYGMWSILTAASYRRPFSGGDPLDPIPRKLLDLGAYKHDASTFICKPLRRRRFITLKIERNTLDYFPYQ